MGFLEEATPLSWDESVKHHEALKANGIEQFLTILNAHASRHDAEMLWGDEQEYALVEVGPGPDDVRLLLRADAALQELRGRSVGYEASDSTSCALWSPEMGNHMVEGVTKPPYKSSLDELALVEESLAFRRKELLEVAASLGTERNWKGLVWTFANFPLLGTADGQAPAQPPCPKRSDGLGSCSRFVPDEVITPHPRFQAFVANMRHRKGAKTCALLPLAADASGAPKAAALEVPSKSPWDLEDTLNERPGGGRTGRHLQRFAASKRGLSEFSIAENRGTTAMRLAFRRLLPGIPACRLPLSCRWQSGMSLQQLYDRRSTSEGYVPDNCQLEVISKLDDLSKSLSGSQTPRGLYLYGGVGTGKTMMLDLFHESLTSKGISCDRQHFHGFLKAVDTSYHKMRMTKRGQSNLLARCAEEYFQKHRVLAFDEAHVLNIGDALLIKAFLEPYFKAGGVVVATSNVAPDDLYASGVNRETFMPFIDTLRRSCEFYQMKGREDYRLRTSQKSQLRGTYYWGDKKPIGDVTPADFPSLMETMECHDLPKAEAMEIDVGFGRRLTCPDIWTTPSADSATAGKKIARFSFDELCRRATGPSEWLGLAENLDAILVTEVPRFEAHDEDAARRFITFIDVVYDHKRFLGITARTSPEDIFREFITKYGGAGSHPVVGTARACPSTKNDVGVHLSEAFETDEEEAFITCCLCLKFRKLRSQKLLCDVVLATEQTQYLAHQVILAAAFSPAKEHIFAQNKDQASPAPELSLPPSALQIQLENLPSDESVSTLLDETPGFEQQLNGHGNAASNLLEQLQQLQSKGQLCDMLLSVGTEHFAAHQVILAAAGGDAFRTLILDGASLGLQEVAETQPLELELRGVKSADAVPTSAFSSDGWNRSP
eukprot:s3170_g7.t1